MKKKLSEVLQMKKDLHEEIAGYEKQIRIENCIIKGNPRSINVKETYDKWLKALTELAQLKEILQKANIPIYPKIFEHDSLSEKKRLLGLLKINEGKRTFKNGNTTEIIEMEAALTKSFVTAEVTKLDARIKELRNELTEFNNNTEIEL